MQPTGYILSLMPRYFLWLVLAALVCAQEVSQSGLELRSERAMVSQPVRAGRAMVASASEIASQTGLDVLQQGGSAVDAAVAVAFALAVVYPEAGNLGGGGYMLIRMADGRTKVIDYRETAPAAAREGMFRNPKEARVGYRASAVPGTVAGLALAHRMFGTKPWRDLLEPARNLALRGFPVSQRMDLILPLQFPVMRDFPESAKVFLHSGMRPLHQGELFRQRDLAATIARLQRHGADDFYTGETALRIDRDMRAHSGTITLQDLKGYRAVVRDPIQTTYRGYPVLTAPPSTAGGMTLLEMLNILEQFPAALGEEGSTTSRHRMIEAMRRAYRDRAAFAADPEFFPVPVAQLIAKDHGRELARDIDPDHATASQSMPAVSAESGFESNDTTHFSIVDRDGNMVSNTYTLNGFYGSQVVIQGTGMLMNDIMSGFSMMPGTRASIAPGKRPVSSMTPTIVLRQDGSPWFALGSPGASTIPNTVLQVIVNIIDYKMSLRDAIEYPRIHQSFLPDRVDAEPGALVQDVGDKLRAMGHVLNPRLRSQGDVHAVMIDPDSGWRLGWSDGRRGGRALGF